MTKYSLRKRIESLETENSMLRDELKERPTQSELEYYKSFFDAFGEDRLKVCHAIADYVCKELGTEEREKSHKNISSLVKFLNTFKSSAEITWHCSDGYIRGWKWGP